MIQNFSYHTHTNTFGKFDGQNSIKEMIDRAKALGWSHMGISNHLIVHPEFKTPRRSVFVDYHQATEMYKRLIDEIRVAADKENFPVLVGFEVDYFRDPVWEKWFEHVVLNLGADYLIGSTHVWGQDETGFLFLELKNNAKSYTPEDIRANMGFYFDTQKALVESGYFTFLAHMDVQRRYQVEDGNLFQEQKHAIIEKIIKAKLPVEVNTSGLARGMAEPHPSIWILKELQKANIPVVLSDDAHHIDHLGRGFEQAEDILKNLNYTPRFSLK